MSRYDRWNSILELLAQEGRLSVEDAAEALDVSTATIRRDFDQLAQQQMLMRTRGGAVAQSVSYDLPLRYKTARHADEKHRIAAAAAELVSPGAVIGMNGGTTTSELARSLATRSTLEAGFTIVTNALNIASELTVRQHVKIVVTGGVARPQSYELIGPLAGGVLEQVTLDVAFLGVDAIDVELGASAHHEGEASVNNLLISRGRPGRRRGRLLQGRQARLRQDLPDRQDRHPRDRRTAPGRARRPAQRGGREGDPRVRRAVRKRVRSKS
ncbi:DeoR/GlpR family DNA-binding transcription regulator [Nonomuraea dietziae]|uniref:DeoR family transcriptional regulator of aga operon n=1 Tax=Nonomuraea dietziae TaxID=65515 RepID=A0A7W5VBS1_9ACTN|nr:DeoR/GlpR family DNA-binding transcription regulator [Nonomuraea dietziae]MBB3728575.1 DeoR family transcriptional regulator of aga operon [Nonomuraea dietziae]